MRFSLTYPIISKTYDRSFLEQKNMIRFSQAAEAAGFDAMGFTDHPAPSQEWLASGGHDALDPFLLVEGRDNDRGSRVGRSKRRASGLDEGGLDGLCHDFGQCEGKAPHQSGHRSIPPGQARITETGLFRG